MASFCKVTLIGNVGQELDSKYTASGTMVASTSLAVNDKRKDGNGEVQEKTQWYRLTWFGKAAENAAQYVKKGTPLYVEGPLSVRDYTNKDGQQKYSLDVNVREWQMLGGRDQPDDSQGATRETASKPRRSVVTEPIDDDSFPF